PLAQAAGEGGDALPVEVALETMADRLVQEDPRPAGRQDDGHRAGRRGHRPELHDRLPRRLAREPAPALLLEEEVERHAAAPAERPDLAPAALLDDDGHVQACQWPDIGELPAGRGGDEDRLLLGGE